ncbi:MAG: hypothetical protein LIO79_03905 [Rikenellaceae bacterium]|nr:hypothetical protein [Rikenellaceae bacterium]
MPRRLVVSALLLFMAASVSAQYYDEGRDPYSVKWRQKKNERLNIIYPEVFEDRADVVASVIDTAYNSLHYGLTKRARSLPIVLHGYNLQSNGVVSWAPKHAELVIIPPVNSFAVPWLKQLAIHEYRHVVQLSNLNRNVVKYAGWVIGEQSVGAAGLLVPIWFLEGDATFAETALSSYGRGLQPEFILEYRAYLDGSDTDMFPVDKWFCGSYKDYIPNHYNLGFQLTNYTYRTYGTDFWENVIDYSTRKPYLIAPRNIAYKKYYGTSSKKLFRDAFGELKKIWDSLPAADDSAEIIETPHRSYTLYSYPLFVNDSLVISLKYDLTDTYRFVITNINTAEEAVVAHTGSVNSRPVYHSGELLWTESRAGTFWEQKTYSVICRADLDVESRKLKNKNVYRNLGDVLFVTPYRDGFAGIGYNKGVYSLKKFDNNFTESSSVEFPSDISVHGLAWDESMDVLAFIGLGEDGMFISSIDPVSGPANKIKKSSFVAVNNLAAGSGRLVFNSIESGRDEIHFIDLADGAEYRITESRYGSIMPSVDMSRDRTVQVSYRRDGYYISTQEIIPTDIQEVDYKRLPDNILNAPLAQFDVANVDTMSLYGIEPIEINNKKYRKGLHLFNIHSWAPISFDPFQLSDDSDFEPDLGFTVISQNVLSTVSGFLSYGRADGENYLRGKVHFDLFAPKFEVSLQYGGGKAGMIAGSPDGYLSFIPAFKIKDYFTVNARVYLPFNISAGYVLRTFTPSLSVAHYNTLVYDYNTETFTDGYQRFEFSLNYAQNVRMAYRDIYPRLGYYIRLSYGGAPFAKHFGDIYSTYAGVYVPGVMANHALRISGLYQYQNGSIYNFRSNMLFPQGVRNNFTPEWMYTVTGDYKFPVAYPDNGISGVLYIKRIYAGLYGGYSRYKPLMLINRAYNREVYSYGAEIVLNTNPFRMSNADLDLKGAVYFPSDSKKPTVKFTMSINL